jgi:quercetin dioxygenase-like cupin family protein
VEPETQTDPTQARGASAPVNLPKAATELLQSAHASGAGRAGRTLTPGAGVPLKQTLLALVAGQSLADHESPGAATLHVLTGAIRLTGGPEDLELHRGDHAAIPSVRHGVDALDDAVVLITIAQSGGREAA